MITQEEVREVANSIGQEITQEQVEEVIALYDGACEEDPSGRWDQIIEKIINDILYA